MPNKYQNIRFLEKLMRDEISPVEKEKFEQWLRDHPEKQDEISHLITLYRAVGNLKPSAEPDTEKIWSEIEKKIIPSGFTYYQIIRYASAAAILIIAALTTFFLWPNDIVTIRAEAGEHLTWYLPDSSRVTLNAVSTISYDEKKWADTRKIELSGEAFFEVREGKPFEVNTPKSRTEVLGTRFNVNSRDRVERIACQSGSVRVMSRSNRESALLKGGQVAHIDGKKLTVYDRTDLTGEIGWTEGIFRFENAPLSDVIASVRRQFDVEIRIEKQFADERFTGSYSSEDLDKALKIINTVLGSDYRYLDERIVEIY